MTDDRLDAYLELVADRRRRMIIRWLHQEVDGEMQFDQIVDRLHESEALTDGAHREDRSDLAIRLAHVHLPKLSDHGVVEYSPEEGTVQYRPDELVDAVLDSLPEGVMQADS